MPESSTNKSNLKMRVGLPRSNIDSQEQKKNVLPPKFRLRLHEWFDLIEKEFEALYSQNISLQEKIERLEKDIYSTDKVTTDVEADIQWKPQNIVKGAVASSSKGFEKTKAARKLRVQTSKIVSSLKSSSVTCQSLRVFTGHKDGVWDVTARKDQPIIGTASAGIFRESILKHRYNTSSNIITVLNTCIAKLLKDKILIDDKPVNFTLDQTANIWSTDNGRILLQYCGHNASVNSIRFHPCQDLVLTASGDHTAHIWQAALTSDQLKPIGSEDEKDGSELDDQDDDRSKDVHSLSLRTPIKSLTGHTSVIMAADWLPAGEHVITASWDRTANLYDAATGELVSQLIGHDQELTHCCSHPTQRLVVTASKDTTFRLWDFRDTIHSVSVFQGHSESVTSVCFTREDKVVSGSDDRSVKVWDVKNMRSPLATIRFDSSVNRLAVSSNNIIGIPHDNRQVRLYDLNGQRLGRLPRDARQGHRRMVCSVAWQDEYQSVRDSLKQPICNFFTAGFDRVINGWNVQHIKD